MPLVLLLLAAGAVAAGIAMSRKSVPAELTAAMQTKLAKYTTRGPNGEYVFNPDVALGIVRTLAGQLYSYVSQSDLTRITIKPDPSGAPPAADLSALGWARTQNAKLTIMAPVYMAESSSADRFLQAAAPGQEGLQPQLYAVLAYPGTFAQNIAPPGVPQASSPGTGPAVPVPTALSAAQNEIPADLMSLYTDLLQNGVDPVQMEAVAKQLDAFGMNTAAELLRKRIASLGAVQPGSSPAPAPAPVPSPAPAPVPSAQQAVQQAQTLLSTLTPVQKAAAAMNLLLNQHGYKQADQPIYRAFQTAAGSAADGFPGAGTMGKLAATLASMGAAMAPVKVYPWKSTGAYDGVNAPTQAEWTGGASTSLSSTRLQPGGSTLTPSGPAAVQQMLNDLQGNSPPAPGIANMQPAPTLPGAPPGSSRLQMTATAMNNALLVNGYRKSDQPIYKAFQAAAGSAQDGFPGAGTMGKLKAALDTLGQSLAPVTIYPWKSTGAYDGVNAPPAAQWNQ